MRRYAGLLLAACLLAPSAVAMVPSELVDGFRAGTLILETAADRCLRIRTRFAETEEQRSQGLMFIEQMGEFEGMLFPYSPPAVVTMWMKNTLIPLDMVFIRADGRIARIAFNARPYSEARISSVDRVAAVLELNAGFASRWRLRAGNRLLLVD
jgi:uncharacterized membrane protein (UPF0127 family)